MNNLSDTMASLTTWGGKREGYPAAAPAGAASAAEAEVVNTTHKERGGVYSRNLDYGDESGIDVTTASRDGKAMRTSGVEHER